MKIKAQINTTKETQKNAEQIARYAVLCAKHNLPEVVQAALEELNSIVENGKDYLVDAMEIYG